MKRRKLMTETSNDDPSASSSSSSSLPISSDGSSSLSFSDQHNFSSPHQPPPQQQREIKDKGKEEEGEEKESIEAETPSIPSSRKDLKRRPSRATTLPEYLSLKGYLTVSDLVSPSWCEYQYLYTYLSDSHLPISLRPESITTASGATISPTLALVEKREQTLNHGKSVHAALERELYPEAIPVRVHRHEDTWALKLLTLWNHIQTLLRCPKQGQLVAREVPVFGWIRNFFVVGIIDQIDFNSNQKTRNRLSLSDTKTRRSNGIPKVEDQTSARLQCMIYKYLFDNLLQRRTSLSQYAKAMRLDPFVRLSDEFVSDAMFLCDAWDLELFLSSFSSFSLQDPSPSLQDLQLDAKHPCTLTTIDTLLQTSLTKLSRRLGYPATVDSNLSLQYRQQTGKWIGSVQFDYSDQLVQSHVKDSLAMWIGQRPLRGVSDTQTHRCWSCEWREGCEWRTIKAEEARFKSVQAKSIKLKDSKTCQDQEEELWSQFEEPLLDW